MIAASQVLNIPQNPYKQAREQIRLGVGEYLSPFANKARTH